jgi:autotransporter translocation and assembly factor TamB
LRLRQASGLVALDLGWQADVAGRTPRVKGTLALTGPATVWPAALPAAITIAPVVLRFAGDEVRARGLSVSTPGAVASFDGVLRLARAGASTIAGDVTATVDGSALSPWLGGKASVTGEATFSGHLEGPVRAPRGRGRAQLRALSLRWPTSPLGAVRLDGTVDIQGRTLLLRPLVARFESGGWLLLGAPQRPARLEVMLRKPFGLGGLDLRLRGAGLTTLQPVNGLAVRSLAFDLRLAGEATRPLRLAGDISVEHASYRLSRREPPRPARAPSAATTTLRLLRDRLALDLRIHAPDDALVLRVPYAPDVTIGLECHVLGGISRPVLRGQVSGDGLYSRAVLAVADWISGRDLRRCDIGPH